MKYLLIKLLLWLLDSEARIVSDKRNIDEWLSFSCNHPGFRQYAMDRNYKFLKELGGGYGAQPLPRDNYVLKFGQRIELILLEGKAKLAFQEQEKKKKGREIGL